MFKTRTKLAAELEQSPGKYQLSVLLLAAKLQTHKEFSMETETGRMPPGVHDDVVGRRGDGKHESTSMLARVCSRHLRRPFTKQDLLVALKDCTAPHAPKNEPQVERNTMQMCVSLQAGITGGDNAFWCMKDCGPLIIRI